MTQFLRASRKLRGLRSETQDTKDWWDKAAIASSFVSSVVIALIGLLISYTIQQAQLRASAADTKAQIDAAAVRAAEERRLHESELTAQLLQHLVSDDPVQRGVAIVALRTFARQDTYDDVLEVLATSDESANVRSLAIEQLGESKSPTAAATLSTIVHDKSKPLRERHLAARSTLEIGVRETVHGKVTPDSTVFVLGAAGATETAWVTRGEKGELHGAFTWALLRGLRGGADVNQDGIVVASEVKEFVVANVKRSTPFQTPVVATRGNSDIPFTTVGPNRPFPLAASYGVFIGTYPRKGYPPLREAPEDALAVSTVFNQSIGMRVDVLLAEHATEARVLEALRRAQSVVRENDLFVFFFSGHATLELDGTVRWLFADSSDSGGMTAEEINAALFRIPAHQKVLLIDSAYAGAISQVVDGMPTH